MLRDQATFEKLVFVVGPEFFCDDYLAPRYDLCVAIGSLRLMEQVEFVYCALKSDDAERVFSVVNNWGVNLVAHQFFDKEKIKDSYRRLTRIVHRPLCIGVHSKELCDTIRVPNDKRFDVIPAEHVLESLEMSTGEPQSFAFETNLKNLRDRWNRFSNQ